MRIHRLRISGFGPFAGTEEIDFDKLGAHGLFLLNGPTGAGKTSVLDAICFALYGSVPGARQDGKRLRSDHAEPGQEPRVSCEFSAQGRRFDVTRSPAWDKPSTRGKNGFTTQQAKTLLRERVDGAWIEKSARNDEAGAEILSLLGMDREQFTRVVMLPQGDFAAFLRSKASDRLELLQKLFGTERFEAVEQELARLSLAAREEVSVLLNRLQLLSARAESESAVLDLDRNGAPGEERAEERLEWLRTEAAARTRERQAQATAADSAGRTLAEAVEAESARRDRQRRLVEAEGRRAALEESGQRLENLAQRLGRHRRAEVLAGQLRSVDAGTAKVRSAADAMESAFTLLRLAAGEDMELAQLDIGLADDGPAGAGAGAGMAAGAGTADELNRLRLLVAVVEARLPDEDHLKDLRARHSALAKKHQDLLESGDVLVHRLENLLQERTVLSGSLEQLQGLAGVESLRAKEATAAEELLAVVRRYRSALAARGAAKLIHDEAREDQLHTKQQWLEVREQRLANAAAELAEKLVHGIPCPVCGNPEHPAPAAGGGAGPGLAQAEEEAHALYENAEAQLIRASRNLTEADQQVAVLAGQGGETPEAEAVEAAAQARAAATDAQHGVKELAAVRQRLEVLDTDVSAARESLAARDRGLALAASSLADVAEQIAALDSALAGLRGGHRSLAHRVRALERAVATLGKAVDAQARLDAARAQAADAVAQLESALPEAGFSTADEARAYLLPATEAAALEAEIRAGQNEAARVAELFASPDMVLALEEKEAGEAMDEQQFGALQAKAAAAMRQAREADLAAGMAAGCLKSLTEIRAAYAELADSARGPAEKAQLLAGLADAAAGRGENTYRMSLNSYVLAARLEQVAVAASERLVAMSDGRYLLQHTDAKAARGAKSGLGLEVVDQWTGHRRDTSTLSGGESFMASLSLALGLADVVQQEAGGVEIETLFVDEGFGSLDEQSLEQVMDALEGLRDGGRVVGLVSHVAEMKQRIGMQLQVFKGRNGSTVRITEAADAPARP